MVTSACCPGCDNVHFPWDRRNAPWLVPDDCSAMAGVILYSKGTAQFQTYLRAWDGQNLVGSSEGWFGPSFWQAPSLCMNSWIVISNGHLIFMFALRCCHKILNYQLVNCGWFYRAMGPIILIVKACAPWTCRVNLCLVTTMGRHEKKTFPLFRQPSMGGRIGNPTACSLSPGLSPLTFPI